MVSRVSTFTERVTVFFTPEQLAKINDEADKRGLPLSAFIRMVVVKAVSE